MGRRSPHPRRARPAGRADRHAGRPSPGTAPRGRGAGV